MYLNVTRYESMRWCRELGLFLAPYLCSMVRLIVKAKFILCGIACFVLDRTTSSLYPRHRKGISLDYYFALGFTSQMRPFLAGSAGFAEFARAPPRAF
jgi:hypothetical protein